MQTVHWLNYHLFVLLMTTDDNNIVRQQLRERGICVVIPTYNNDGTIEHVVRKSLELCADVIVVNDGSTDATSSLLHRIDGITMIENDRNRGKGYALKRGFQRAMEMGFAYAITLDGDGQHSAEDIPRFLQANREHPGALIVGRRQLDGVQRSRGSRFANQFSNFWFAVETGRYLPDTQTGYRLYPLRKLRWLSLLTSRYEAELELLVVAAWHGVELCSILIDVYYPPMEQRISHFRPATDFGRISLTNCILCLLAGVYGWPLTVLRWLLRLGRTLYALLFFLLATLLVTPGVWLYTGIGRMTDKKLMGLHRLIQRMARFVMQTHGVPGTTFTCHMADGTDFSRPHVIVCNHQSHLDLMCQLQLAPNMVFLTNSWVWHSPFFGLLVRKAGFCLVTDGIDTLLPRLRELADKGYNIAVYPEGTRSADCRIGRFHQGAFHIAQQLDLDVLPMYLYGTGRVLSKKARMLRPGPIHLEVGKPLTRAELNLMGTPLQQARNMRRMYVEKYEQLCNKIEQYV